MCIQSKVENLYFYYSKNGCGLCGNGNQCDDCLVFLIDTSIISTSTTSPTCAALVKNARYSL